MKPADNPDIDYKDFVRAGYDSCAGAYDQARSKEVNPELGLLTSRLRDGAQILDIGCGAGIPVSRTLAERFSVIGVDISGEMIKRARANVPRAELLQGDIMTMDFPPGRFDAIVSFHAVFHLPREEHPELFRSIHTWLKPGGYLLATVASHNEAPYTENDFFGVSMYWSNYGLDEYREMLRETGFTLLGATILGHGYTQTHMTREETHPLVFAQKQ
jgi:cyclopropane fatty-acyl-phospholipid synthase-like methyltransferase